MTLRTHHGAAVLGALALSACGVSSQPPDAGWVEPPAGCVGVCSQDGGTSSTSPDGGGDGGATTEMTIATLRQTAVPGQRVILRNMVVHARDKVSLPLNGSGQNKASFWVRDLSRPGEGLYIEKSLTDAPSHYDPLPGDVLTITGYVQEKGATWDRSGYRTLLASEFALDGGSGRLSLEWQGTAPEPEPVGVAAGFGNADGGFSRPNPEYAGALVRIPGPLTLTNREPQALRDTSVDGGYNGFEVEGGVLVSNAYTFPLCDWQTEDAGVGGMVVFPEGITGVWDTYTHAGCKRTEDGRCIERHPGNIPGTYDPVTRDGGSAYTYVLYPRGCDDVRGLIVSGPMP